MAPPRTDQISPQELQIFLTLRRHQHRWLANGEITKLIGAIHPRTTRLHTKRFAELGVVDCTMLAYSGHRFRLAKLPTGSDGPASAYVVRLELAAKVLGLNMGNAG